MSSNTTTVAFFGASTGVGLSALKHSLAAGHHCIALFALCHIFNVPSVRVFVPAQCIPATCLELSTRVNASSNFCTHQSEGRGG